MTPVELFRLINPEAEEDCNALLTYRYDKAAREINKQLKGAVWRCFHCDEVFSDPQQAAEHFGPRRSEPAKCVKLAAELERFQLMFMRLEDEYRSVIEWANRHGYKK